jgi:hypothetical protein
MSSHGPMINNLRDKLAYRCRNHLRRTIQSYWMRLWMERFFSGGVRTNFINQGEDRFKLLPQARPSSALCRRS